DGEDDLEHQLYPIDAGSRLDADALGDQRADEGRGDADDDGEDPPDGLPARKQQTPDRADDGADDDGAQDGLDCHDSQPPREDERFSLAGKWIPDLRSLCRKSTNRQVRWWFVLCRCLAPWPFRPRSTRRSRPGRAGGCV